MIHYPLCALCRIDIVKCIHIYYLVPNYYVPGVIILLALCKYSLLTL